MNEKRSLKQNVFIVLDTNLGRNQLQGENRRKMIAYMYLITGNCNLLIKLRLNGP